MLVFFAHLLLIAAITLLLLQAANMLLDEDRRDKLAVAIGLATTAAIINLMGGIMIGVDSTFILLVVLISLTLLPAHVLLQDN